MVFHGAAVPTVPELTQLPWRQGNWVNSYTMGHQGLGRAG